MTGTLTYSAETANLGLTPAQRVSDVAQRGRSKLLRNTITLASQAYGATGAIALGSLPNGSRFQSISYITDTSLSSSTITVTNSATTAGSPTAYTGAATLTATQTKTNEALVSALAAAPVTADTPLYANIGVANLPASGTLIIDVEYVEW